MPAETRLGRVAGAALLLACLLALGVFVALLREDTSTAATLLVVFALVTVPALVSAVLGVRAGVTLVRGGPAEAGTAAYAAFLALGHLGVVLLSLRPGLDGRFDQGDLAGAVVGGVGTIASLVALALVAPGRSVGVRLVAALAGGVLLLALAVLRGVAQVT